MNLIHAMVVYFTECYLRFFSLAHFCIVIWKGAYLPYRSWIYWLEVSLLVAILAIQWISIQLSRMDLEHAAGLLLVPTLAGLLYVLLWQQFVLRVEIITVSIFLGFQSFYILSSLIKS